MRIFTEHDLPRRWLSPPRNVPSASKKQDSSKASRHTLTTLTFATEELITLDILAPMLSGSNTIFFWAIHTGSAVVVMYVPGYCTNLFGRYCITCIGRQKLHAAQADIAEKSAIRTIARAEVDYGDHERDATWCTKADSDNSIHLQGEDRCKRPSHGAVYIPGFDLHVTNGAGAPDSHAVAA